MKQKIAPGAELEALTPAEAESLIAEALGVGGRPQVPVRGDANLLTNAAGSFPTPLVLYRVPPGMAFRLTRLYVADDTHTFATAAAVAGGSIQVLRNEVVIDGVSLVAAVPGGGSIPWVFSWSESQAPFYMNGEECAVQVTGLATLNIVARFQGELLAAVPDSTLDRDGQP